MQEIALGCGFESVRTFNRAFSEETGISPSEYRRAHQQCTALNLDVNPAPAKKSE
jgi:bacterial regulatory helix-turn-helix proteins, araC family